MQKTEHLTNFEGFSIMAILFLYYVLKKILPLLFKNFILIFERQMKFETIKKTLNYEIFSFYYISYSLLFL